MQLFIPTSSDAADPRVACLPDQAKQFVNLGASLSIESGLGDPLKIPDQAYIDAGATAVSRADGIAAADMVLRLNEPTLDEIAELKSG